MVGGGSLAAGSGALTPCAGLEGMALGSGLIEGRCHCGNISFLFARSQPGKRITVRCCGCSFCRMHGGAYTSDPAGELDITVRDERQLNRYRFGTETAEFYICSRCGVVLAVVSKINGRLYAVVNVNTFQNVDSSDLESADTDFEGESTKNRLDRRARTWIPAVRINDQLK